MNSTKKKILFLVEGEVTEPRNIREAAKTMLNLNDSQYSISSYKASIYELYEELEKDRDLYIVSLLVEKGLISLEQNVLPKQAFSQIYLVFDFDPHYHKFQKEKITDLLFFFDNETENGKLYINYPMFESLFLINDFNHPSDLLFEICTETLKGKDFKGMVKKTTCYCDKNHIKLEIADRKSTLTLIKWNCIRYLHITGLDFYKEIDHLEVLQKQIEKNDREKKIYAISMFALFMVDFNPQILDNIEKEIGFDYDDLCNKK